MKYSLKCTSCTSIYGPKSQMYRCNKCNSILEVDYKYPDKIDLGSGKIKHSKYKQFFPTSGKLLSLGEGGTPIVNYKIGNVNLMLKLETHNPTNSFKDRGSSVEITKAIELGFKEVCCASTGNMGFSIATYAQRFGKKCTIFISKDAKIEKIAKIKKAGAEIVEIKGDFNTALGTAELFSKVNNIFLCGDYHYRKEGQKSIVFEIFDQLGKLPDFIILPVGNATLLAALYKGIKELRKIKMINKLPRLIAVQARGCDPLVRAYNQHKRLTYMHSNTKADAIAVGYPTFGFEGVEALKETNGLALSVSDAELEFARRKLHESRIYSELGGAASFAGTLKINKTHPALFKGKSVFCLITGNN